jgi:uncharacterized membrane protein YfcA
MDTQLLFFGLVFATCFLAGLIGSWAGLGGGVVVVPLLTIGFGLPIHTAIGASLVAVIATSSGAAAAYVRDRLTNLRLGMFLEIATTLGAVTGAFLATSAPAAVLFLLFGLVLLGAIIPPLMKLGEDVPQGVHNDRWATALALEGSYPDRQLHREVAYEVTHVPLGFGAMYVAGALSGMLGIGSGPFKVVALDTIMRLPLKVSTTTSNFMIGVTAAASAGIYFARGDIDPGVTAPVALGVLAGATLGAKLLPHMRTKTLKTLFILVLAGLSVEMLLRGVAMI